MDLLSMFNELDDAKPEIIHSPLNYPGNKIELMDFILPHLPKSKKFGDVFGGSGQMIISREPCDLEIYNDLDNGVTSFFKVMQDPVLHQELYKRCHMLVHSKQLFEEFKQQWPQEQDPLTKAVMFYYVVQASHLSRGRTWGKVTSGKADIYRKIDRYLPLFSKIHNRFRKVQIENMHWEKLIPTYDDYDMVWYCDPPYYDSNEYKHRMTREDHKRFLDLVFKSKGYFAVSGYKSDLYMGYKWAHIEHTTVRANVNTVDQSRTAHRSEYLYIKEVG